MKELIVQFYEKYADYAYRVALVRTNNKADAEDLAQEVVLKIIKNHDILKDLINKDESHAKGYLAKAVVNMTIERYKKSSTRLKRETNFANTKMVVIDESDASNNSDENKHAILNAIKDLPEKYQTIIMLKFYEGHSNTELSSLLNLKEVSIRSLISRAIQKLKNKLAVTSVSLSIASITKNLEATELIPATPEFKAKLIQNIQNNYEAIPLTSSSAIGYKIMGFLFFGVFTSFILFKYAFPFFKKPPVTEQIAIIQKKTQKNNQAVVENKPLFSFDLNMKNPTSRAQLNKLVNSILDIENNKKFVISFVKKGITTVGPDDQDFKLPYTLMPGKALAIYCEAEILSSNGPKHSSIGLDLTLFASKKYFNSLISNGDNSYSIKYTILNKALFVESTIFEGIRSYEIDEGDFHNPIGLRANNAIIKRITLHELATEELNQFKEKNATHIQEMEAYLKKNKSK